MSVHSVAASASVPDMKRDGYGKFGGIVGCAGTPLIQRRHALVALSCALAQMTVHAQGKRDAFRAVAAPEPLAQICAGGPATPGADLLGVSVNGDLFALSLTGGSARRLGGGLDPATPLAVGHGRIAARRRDGALWVLEGGRVSVSQERTLASAAGLLVLPLAVIAIAVSADGKAHRVVRLEGSGTGHWSEVARSGSDVTVMPDARPLQADLDGSGDAGHVVVLAGPDSQRYTHGVLGDAIEATRIVLLERHSLRVMRELVLDSPYVFEDIAPRKVALGSSGSREGLLTVQAGPQGAQLVLVDANPSVPGALRIAARGPALGTANRWLSPITDGRQWLAVHTPHIGGVLHIYRQDGEALLARRLQGDVSNHRIGSRLLDISAWQGPRLLIPDRSGRRLLLLDPALDPASDWRVVGEHQLASRAEAMVSLIASGQVAVLLNDGSVSVGSVLR
jgi:hypothetical protein